MLRLLIFFIVFHTFIHAEDQMILNTHMRIIPKIMALYPITKKTDTAILAIVYTDGHQKIAEKVAMQINETYRGKAGGFAFKALPVASNKLNNVANITFIYILKMNPADVSALTSWATANTIPTFAYDVSDLTYGALGSISIERSTVIYISKSVLKNGKFRFDDSLFTLTRLIE